MDENVKKAVVAGLIITVLAGAMLTGVVFLDHAVISDPNWAEDTANKLDKYGGTLRLVDGSSITIYAHLKPTTGVDYKNGAFYITDPNNGSEGLIIVPVEKVARVYTQG